MTTNGEVRKKKKIANKQKTEAFCNTHLINSFYMQTIPVPSIYNTILFLSAINSYQTRIYSMSTFIFFCSFALIKINSLWLWYDVMCRFLFVLIASDETNNNHKHIYTIKKIRNYYHCYYFYGYTQTHKGKRDYFYFIFVCPHCFWVRGANIFYWNATNNTTIYMSFSFGVSTVIIFII